MRFCPLLHDPVAHVSFCVSKAPSSRESFIRVRVNWHVDQGRPTSCHATQYCQWLAYRSGMSIRVFFVSSLHMRVDYRYIRGRPEHPTRVGQSCICIHPSLVQRPDISIEPSLQQGLTQGVQDSHLKSPGTRPTNESHQQ